MPADFTRALLYKLNSVSGIASVVGTRIYPQTLPELPVLPAVVFTMIPGGSVVRGHGEQAGLFRPTVQFDFSTGTHLATAQLEDLFFETLDGKRETWGETPYWISVQSCLAVATPVDLSDPSTGLYRMTRDYRIMWKEI